MDRSEILTSVSSYYGRNTIVFFGHLGGRGGGGCIPMRSYEGICEII